MKQKGIAGFLSLIAFGNLTCEEVLPPFVDPVNVIRGDVITSRYILVVDANSLEITLSVKNKYDETLEGVTNLEGSIELTLDRLPTVHRTMPFNFTSLFTSKTYNSSTKVLRFDPGDSLVFKVRWDFVDDNGDSLKNSVFRFNMDPSCPYRCIAEEETFSITAKLRLFDVVPEAMYGPLQFSVCYVNNWVDGNVCMPILPQFSCSSIQSNPQPCSGPE